jgi:hypothetical protein
MKYERQNFSNGQVLTAECLNRMEAGIQNACEAVPPICSSTDCSKVLSYGENGYEWVDMPQAGGGSLSAKVIDDMLVVTITGGLTAKIQNGMLVV